METEPPGEALAVVGQDLVGDPVAGERGSEHLGHRLGRGPPDQAGSDAEATVIVDPGDDLELSPIVQLDAAHHVHLPQLHRPLTLEAAELVSALAAPAELDQTVTAQAPVDARASGERFDASDP